jgi:hypothetical protein
MPKYKSLVKSVRMSQYGYWIVTWSIAPAVDMSIMICKTGISPETAASLAAVTLVTHRKDQPSP